MRPRRFLGFFKMSVSRDEVAAHPQENAFGTDRCEVALRETVVGVQEVFDAIGLGQKYAFAKTVDVDFRGAGLVAADEMTGQPDASHRQPEPARDEQIECAQADWVAAAFVNDPVHITTSGLIAVMIVAGEAQLLKEKPDRKSVV